MVSIDLYWQLLKYGLVGVLNTLVTLLSIFVLMKLLNVSYIISNAAGYLFGFTNSFVLNKIWTFRSKGPVGREGILFIAIFLICYGIQLICLLFFKEIVYIRIEVATIMAMVVYTGLNFLGNKFITFRSGGENV